MLTATGRVQETRQILATQFNFRLRTPDLIIKVSQSGNYYWKDGYDLKSIFDFVFSLCCRTANREGRGGTEDVSRDFIY